MSNPSKMSRAASPTAAQVASGSARGARMAQADVPPALVQRPAADEARAGEDASLSGPTREGEVRWRQLLAAGTPREILCRIVQGDPLDMRERVARRLHEQAYLLDADRVQLRSLARCARFANRYPGRPDLATWLDEIVDQAIDDLLREDVEGELERDAAGSTTSAAFSALARPLGLEPEAMRRACAAFNQLPPLDRRAFFALVIHGRLLDELARAGRESASEIARRARRALDLLLQLAALEPTSTESKVSATGTRARERAASEPSARDLLTSASVAVGRSTDVSASTAPTGVDRPRPKSSAAEPCAGEGPARTSRASASSAHESPGREAPECGSEDRS